MSKILITTSSFNIDTPSIKAIQGLGYEVVLNPYKRRLSEEEITGLLTDDIIGLIAGVEPLTKKVLDGAKNLQVISRCGIGMDSVDVDAASANNILVYNTPDAPTKAVAELTIALILDTLRSVSLQDRSIRNGKWVRPMGGLFGARTLGLIGFGRIGQKVAEYASVFGTNIIAYDPISQQNTDAKFVTLDTLLEQSDIVSLHIPYSEDNHHVIGADQIAKMKKGAILINASRGGLVDENALADALNSEYLSAAALDVYEEEPYKGRLTEVDNVILTAHTGSYAKEARIEQEKLSAENLYTGLTQIAGNRDYG